MMNRSRMGLAGLVLTAVAGIAQAQQPAQKATSPCKERDLGVAAKNVVAMCDLSGDKVTDFVVKLGYDRYGKPTNNGVDTVEYGIAIFDGAHTYKTGETLCTSKFPGHLFQYSNIGEVTKATCSSGIVDSDLSPGQGGVVTVTITTKLGDFADTTTRTTEIYGINDDGGWEFKE